MKTGQCDWCGSTTTVYPAILGDTWSMLTKDSWMCSTCRTDVKRRLNLRYNERMHIAMRGHPRHPSRSGYQEFDFDMIEA